MSKVHTGILPKNLLPAIRDDRPHTQVSQVLVDSATTDPMSVLVRFSTRPDGLTTAEAAARFAEHGPNVLAKDQRPGVGKLLWHAVLNPLVILLAILASISFATGDLRAGIMMSAHDRSGRGIETHSGSQGRQRGGQAKSHDFGHRHRDP